MTVSRFPSKVLSGEELRSAITRFAQNPLYADSSEMTNDDNPYRRQIRPQDLGELDFTGPLEKNNLTSYQALAGQRILTTLYELDLVFLPKAGFEEKKEDFDRFYSPDNRTLGEMIRPALEQQCFGFLDQEIDVSGKWNTDSMVAFLQGVHEKVQSTWSAAESAILESVDPQRAALMWLIQFAPDYLSEASPMVRNMLGYYGKPQSEWFKIIIDEYGYGVHDTKHSKLYENTLESVGLRTDAHHYWQYYLSTSLMMNNYFHYIGKNHEFFFRYAGALFYVETARVVLCRKADNLLRKVFGSKVDTKYFTEHVHIDDHHGEMALTNVVLPLVEGMGESIIPEIVRGFEEFQIVGEVADQEFADQIFWMDNTSHFMKLFSENKEELEMASSPEHLERKVSFRDEIETTRSHNTDHVYHVVSGYLRIITGYGTEVTLGPGQGILIPAHRLYGTTVESEECQYHSYPTGKRTACSL